MTPRLRLQVVLWVPVGVVDDDGIGSRQVDAQAACTRTQQEDEAIGLGTREAVNGCLTQVPRDTTVNALVNIPGELHNTITQTFALSWC